MKSTTSVLDGGANFSGIHRFYFFEVLVIVNDFFDGFDDGGALVSFTGELKLERNDGQEQDEKSVAGKAASAQMVAVVKQTTNPNQGEPVLKSSPSLNQTNHSLRTLFPLEASLIPSFGKDILAISSSLFHNRCHEVSLCTATTTPSMMFDKEKISKLKKEVLIVNNAQGAIMDTRAVVDACNSGHITGLLALLNQYNDIAALQVQM
ncbi:hypothetical protein FXO37_32432 [Capsicum annuum]|nr:hypothetical protein FXO37_32432 [Capsicum annuum]